MADREFERLHGDAALVLSKGAQYTQLAAAIRDSMTSLQNIVDDTATTAQSMVATRKLAGDVLEDVGKALDRYETAGSALTTYGNALGPAVDESAAAADEIYRLEMELDAARVRQVLADDSLRWLPDDAPAGEIADARRAAQHADAAVDETVRQIGVQQARWRAAKDAKDAAARTAQSAIEEVVTGSRTHGLTDSTWDKIKHVAASLYEAFKVVCDIAGILAVFLSWVPVLGQVLIVLAAVGALIKVVEATVKAIRGEGSWWAVAGAAVMAVLSIYGGRAISGVAKWAKGRAVLDTAADLGQAAAKGPLGPLLRESEAAVGMTKGGRIWDIVKSPFVRTATQREAYLAFKSPFANKGAQALANLKSAFAEAFPIKGQLSGMAQRFALGSDDVAKLFAAQTDGVVKFSSRLNNIASVATMAQIGLRFQGVTSDTTALGQAIASGDPGEILQAAGGQVAGLFDGEAGTAFSGVVGGFEMAELVDQSDWFGIPELSHEGMGAVRDALVDHLPR